MVSELESGYRFRFVDKEIEVDSSEVNVINTTGPLRRGKDYLKIEFLDKSNGLETLLFTPNLGLLGEFKTSRFWDQFN